MSYMRMIMYRFDVPIYMNADGSYGAMPEDCEDFTRKEHHQLNRALQKLNTAA